MGLEDSKDIHAVQQTLLGNTEAYSEVVERYTPVLFSLALRMLGDREAAEEATQDIFLKMYRSLGSFKLGKRFYPWMYTVALNHLRNMRQARHRSAAVEALSYDDEIQIHRNPDSPDSRAINREGERLAQEALASLKPRLREVFILREMEEMSVEETAEILGVPEGTVKTHLHRARKQLLDALKKQGYHGPA